MITVSTAQIRRMDQKAIMDCKIPSLFLMENAALAVAEAVQEQMTDPAKRPVAVVCGTGNNGGDGLACARLLLECGIPVTTFLVGKAEKLTPDAAENLHRLQQVGGSIVPYTGQHFAEYGCIVDAVFGFGLNRKVGGIYRQAIDEINASGVAVIACDIPSGLNGDTGEPMGTAVKATRTITFTFAKNGLVRQSASPYVGMLTVADIGIPEEVKVMKKIIAINAGPRTGWNTDRLVKEAARGAEEAGAQVEYIDLFKLERFTGCVSCFGCKLPKSYGKCICRDGLSDVLEKIRNADGLIIGSPNYLGNLTASFRALYERLVFQVLTYNREKPCCNERKIPVLLIMTSNCGEEIYDAVGYTALLEQYRNTLTTFVGDTKVLACGDTLQVSDYSRFDWTLFDPAAKKAHHDETFDAYLQKAFTMGGEMGYTNL